MCALSSPPAKMQAQTRLVGDLTVSGFSNMLLAAFLRRPRSPGCGHALRAVHLLRKPHPTLLLLTHLVQHITNLYMLVIARCLDIRARGSTRVGYKSQPGEGCCTQPRDIHIVSPAARTQLKDMPGAEKKRCLHAGCMKGPTYGEAGTRKVEFCAPHARPGMVAVLKKLCSHPGCTTAPSYGIAGSKTAEFCSPHKKENMVDVNRPRCDHPGCHKARTYGYLHSNRAEFCAAHAVDQMVNLHKKRCVYQGCTKRPTFGVPGTKSAMFCVPHAPEGLVNVAGRTCAHSGCNKQPFFGISGSGKAEFCRAHAADEMVDVLTKLCGHQGCSKRPAWGIAGSKIAEFCTVHAKQGMVTVKKRLWRKTCLHPGCTKRPTFGVPGTKSPMFCAPHAPDSLINVDSRSCAHAGANEEGVSNVNKRPFPTTGKSGNGTTVVSGETRHLVPQVKEESIEGVHPAPEPFQGLQKRPRKKLDDTTSWGRQA